VAGGSGVVPLMAMLRLARRMGRSHLVRLLVSVRTPDDLYFAAELPGPEATVVYTRAAPPGTARGAGRMTLADVAPLVRGGETVFVCGSEGFAEAATDLLLAAGELVADKLPTTPSRLAPPSLGGRLLFGGTSAAAVARRDGHDPVLPALVGAASALGMSVLGARLRGVAAQRFGSDKPGAFVEDGLAAALGWLGARRRAA
jgi:uncharacterized membrane protein